MDIRNVLTGLGLAAALCATGCAPDDHLEGASGILDMASIDAIFQDVSGDDGPGCAVAVSRDGQEIMARAYGMSNLETDTPNGAETIFEAGSVSKQFASAAVIMLAMDGELSLDDDIREHFPEMPDYGSPITVRMLTNHTSGLRDWGSVASIEGWPRWSRVHEHLHAFDIISRQRALNYPPGEYYSYTNSGYTLIAMLVERVTGKSFEEFSQSRIFRPLGMTNTQWRDDFSEIVKGRSVAYRRGDDGEWRSSMPFENVYGNGGLLTTVSDLLKFTHNLETGEVGGPEFLDLMHQRGVLNSGKEISYASGLVHGFGRGTTSVGHGGATAGYRAQLTRYPEAGFAVSVLCNLAEANAWDRAASVAGVFFGDSDSGGGGNETAPEASPADVQTAEAVAGLYRDPRNGWPVRVSAEGASIRVGSLFAPDGEGGYSTSTASLTPEWMDAPELDGRRVAALVRNDPNTDALRLERVEPFEPTTAQLQQYTGTYTSDEAEAAYTVVVEQEQLALADRYDRTMPLEPVYEDGFSVGPTGAILIFRRDGGGRVVRASLSQGRVWDLRLERVR